MNLKDTFVSKGDGQVMSAMCSLFNPSLIASSVSPSKETLAILADLIYHGLFPTIGL